jgi:hypothetical protein
VAEQLVQPTEKEEPGASHTIVDGPGSFKLSRDDYFSTSGTIFASLHVAGPDDGAGQ